MGRETHASPSARQMRSAQRSALVTGAGRGIGRGIALALAEAGWAVVINYRANVATANETAELAREAGGETLVVQADVGAAADRARLVEAALERFGRIDLLVNNAGMGPRTRLDILETDRGLLRRGDERKPERAFLPQPTRCAHDAGTAGSGR